MGECLIKKTGSGVNTNDLTANRNDVLENKQYFGSGSDEIQTGTMRDRGALIYELPLNGRYKIPEGYYHDGAKVLQYIPTMGKQEIGPGAKQIVVATAGKYLTGDVIVKSVKNLIPSNIKKGVYVGGVGPGTWEGFINNDPNTPYYYGSFNGIQTITLFRCVQEKSPGTLTLNKNNFLIYNADGGKSSTVVFNSPINLNNLRKLTVTAASSGSPATFDLWRNRVTDYYKNNSNVYNPGLGSRVNSTGSMDGYINQGSSGDFTMDVSSFSGSAYLYFNVSGSKGGSLTVYMVRFE